MKTGFISALVIICIILTQVTAFAAAEWPALSSDGKEMPIRPADGYVSMQNPPAFTWQHVASAVSYELCIYADANFTKKKYSKTDLTVNYHSFDHTFEAGKTYWWRVRYYTSDGSYSEWTEARRFRIDPDAYEFTVPEAEILKSRIPEGHPRVIAKASELEQFRNLKNKSVNALRYYNYITGKADGYYNKYIKGTLDLSKPQRPDTDDPDELYAFDRNIVSKYTALVGYAYECGYAYLLSGDERYAEVAKEILLAISPWGFVEKNGVLVYDTEDVTGYEVNDTIHRVITYKSAMVYDWIYNTMTEEEKAPIRHMIRERGKILSNHLVDGLNGNVSIRQMPYDSHGWTAFGFLGITAYAMYGEFPEAEYWFENVIPAYASILPPWSYQDGGWSQGTDYWKDSTIHGQEFLDVMARAGIINYYETAWGSQEYLWSLYAFPAGSYGAFGDDSNIRHPGTASMDSVSNTTYYTNNPVGKWILNTLGGEYANTINTFYINTDHIEPKAPTDYPLSHEFNDIGWVVMTDDLINTDRVQSYFKSSYYGSFNHSHADQNSFIIQAFGEKLAVKSGYYDNYHSVHDKAITRATFAHNSITIDDGNGQPSQTDDLMAKGDITEFVTQMSFDSATGDATPAYKGALDKYIRHFIYIRPGVFVVIDDLDAKDDTKSSFEWWLNAEDNTLTQYDDNSALIENGNANLKANVIYPQNTTVTYYDGFINPLDGQYYPANARRDYEDWPEHDRVNFATPEVKSTRMVVTMSVFEDGDSADVPQTEYASDGSFVKLTFKDGTKCIVNLKGGNDYITCDGIKFMGEAVTYNDYSIMLTGGSYLEKDGVCLIIADKNLTCAMGYGQLSMSLTEDAYVQIDTTTDYLKVNPKDSITDHKGRKADSAIGLGVDYDSIDYGYLPINAQKGNYMLLTEGSAVNASGLVPEISASRDSSGKYSIVWKEASDTTYDILINGVVYEDVSSPYIITPDNDIKTYNVALRATKQNIVSDWSDSVFISPGGRNIISQVAYTNVNDGVTVSTFAARPAGDKTSYVTALYGSDGTLKAIKPLTPNGDMYTLGLGSIPEGYTARTFLWNGNNISPESAVATYGLNDLGLKELKLDGVELEGYSDSIDEYDIILPEGTDYYPLVSALAKDNATKVVVSHNYSDLKTLVTLTAQDRTERVVTLNYVLETDDIHRVTGATDEADFKTDTGRGKDINGNYTGKMSSSSVATLTYDRVTPDGATTTPTAVNLKVYTNLEGNMGSNHFGSRVASDRAPNTHNHSEFNSPNKSYLGYDHIVAPNDDFFRLKNAYTDGSIRNVKLSFGIDDSAEVVVLSNDDIPALRIGGFKKDIMETVSKGRYTNAPGPEDWYYNIAFNGFTESDFTQKDNMPVNYDVLERMIDVAPLNGYTNYSQYKEASPSKESFAIGNTKYAVDNLYVYDNVFTKRFEEPGNVEIDFGSYTSTPPRFMVIVRPLTPQKPVADFKVTAPKAFEEVDSKLLEGTNDNLETHTTHKLYTENGGGRNLEAGTYFQQENVSGNTVNIINEFLGIEGGLLIPIQSSVDSAKEENNWMRAYYYGAGSISGFGYPAMKGKVNDWYEFTLNRSADVYVIASGNKPGFIDDTWQQLNFPGNAFLPMGATVSYDKVYVKHIDVEIGEPVTVSMKTQGIGKLGAQYFTVVKPVE